MYKLVFKSRKPEAEKFSDWVVSEVLPTIRKTGSYGTTKSLSPMMMRFSLNSKQNSELSSGYHVPFLSYFIELHKSLHICSEDLSMTLSFEDCPVWKTNCRSVDYWLVIHTL